MSSSSNHAKIKIMGGLATLMIVVTILFDLVSKVQVISWLIKPSIALITIASLIFLLSWIFIVTLAKTTKWRCWLSGTILALTFGWLIQTENAIPTVLANVYPIFTGVMAVLLLGSGISFFLAWISSTSQSPKPHQSLPPLHSSKTGTSLPPLRGSTQLPPLKQKSGGGKTLLLLGITIVLVLIFVITSPKTTIEQVQAVMATEKASSSECDPSVVYYPYIPEDDYFLTQELHGQSYGHLAIDVAAGNGKILYSPLCNATVIYNGYDEWGNTKLELQNEFFIVMLLHGVYSLPVGTVVDHSTQIGTESNIGYVVDMAGNLCTGRDCGYHTHLNITDLAGNNLNPLEYFKDRPTGGVAQSPQANILYNQGGGSTIAPLFTKEVQHWAPQIINWSSQHGLDPNMVATVMQIESCGWPEAGSPAGAQGLFQVMPFHFEPGENMQDPDTNAYRGLNYLSEGMKYHNGDTGLTFAGYNGGHGTARKGWDAWANETQRYYVWATGIYEDAQAGSSSSDTLNQWLSSGGASLCQKAALSLGLNP